MYAMINKIDNIFSYHAWVRMTKAFMPIPDIINQDWKLFGMQHIKRDLCMYIEYIPDDMKGIVWILNFLVLLTKLSAVFSSLSLVMGFSMKPYTNGCHKVGVFVEYMSASTIDNWISVRRVNFSQLW
jgi:hypothetical protein